ncbi:MAG: branched-chain amino acid ABC transporter permease [Casimicrobiaceae bacterium]
MIALFAEKYWIDVAILVVIYAGVASAWNLAGGFCGTFSFGHGLFFGIGAYTTAVLFTQWGISPWIGLCIGALLGAASGAFIAWLASRCGIGDLAFAVLTLAAAEIAYLFVDSFEPLGASRGISLPPVANAVVGMQFSSDAMYLATGTGFLVICQIVAWLVYRSAMGHRFRAVRENPVAAEAIGINPTRERILALAISGALTAIAGVVYAQYLLFVNPLTFFGPAITIKVILFALIGGMGTPWGPVLGAALFFPLGESLRAHFGGTFPGFDTLIYGLLVIICIIAFPKGIVGTLSRMLGRSRATTTDIGP